MDEKLKSNSLTEGPITKSILLFAIPIFIGNIFQQLYNVVDTAIIGNYLGDSKLAAVGASAPIYGLVIGFANGFTNGFSVVIAKYFGAKDKKRMKKAVNHAILLTLTIAAVLTLVSLVFLHPILVMLNTPKEIISVTDSYLRIILACAVVTMVYNMFSALLRAVGNSRTPLYFLIVSSIINVGLDVLFVKEFGLGVKGAAYATVIAQLVSVILCIIYVWRKCPDLKPEFDGLKLDVIMLNELFFMGFSMGLMLVVVSIGSVALQGAVNSLGENTIAAHTAARKIDEMCMVPLGTLTMAASTFASQNYGAGNYDRIQKGIKNSIMLAFCWSAFAIFAIYIFGDVFVELLTGTKNKYIVRTAYKYLRINLTLFPVLSILLILRSSLQGLGRKLIPVLGSTVELVMKFLAAGVVVKKMGYMGVCILEPIVWGICSCMVLFDFARCQKELKELDKKELD